MGGLPEQPGSPRPEPRAAAARLTRAGARPLRPSTAFLAPLLATCLAAPLAGPAAASTCAEPTPLAPLCGGALAGEARPGEPGTAAASCRLAVESYLFSLDRWAFCVGSEAARRKLEARRRLDCLERRQARC